MKIKPAFFALVLLLAACSSPDEVRETPVVPTVETPVETQQTGRVVPDDVPLYSEDADVKIVNIERKENAVYNTVVIAMETINGTVAPTMYYNGLEELGWSMSNKISDTGGHTVATKDDRILRVVIGSLPGNAGTAILLEYQTEK